MGVSLSHIGEERVKELEKKPRLTFSYLDRTSFVNKGLTIQRKRSSHHLKTRNKRAFYQVFRNPKLVQASS